MLERLPQVGPRRVVVVGDAMLDLYTWGEVTRISPEAPVPVVAYTREVAEPGGAANAAVCVAALGSPPDLVAKVGNDTNGATLTRLLTERRVRLRALDAASDPTTTKNRIWSGGQQLLRLDVERTSAVGADGPSMAAVLDDVGTAGAVLISDYGKGVVNPSSAAWIVQEADRRRTPVVVDPKAGDFLQFRGCTVIKPNEREAAAAFAARFGRPGSLQEIGDYLVSEVARYAIVTLGANGIALFGDGPMRRFAPRTRTVYDVTGAGDVVAAVVATGLASEWTLDEICEVANIAAGVCVSRVGTGGVTLEEVDEYRAALISMARAESPDTEVATRSQ